MTVILKFLFFLLLFSGLTTLLSACSSAGSWRTASRASAGIAPPAEQTKEAVFQIYSARAYSWRGYFGTHPWVAWKKKDDDGYTVAQVTSWALYRGDRSVTVQKDLPDRYWFGQKPQLIASLQGEPADRVIEQVISLIENYPYSHTYRIWPGPNSNTFVDYLIRSTPELTVELPSSAIGKDYLVDAYFFAKSPSGKGFQFSIFGLFGFTVGLAEGIEVNFLGMTFGIDVLNPALKLPFLGRVGLPDKELYGEL